MSVFPLWMIIKLYLIQLTSFEHLLDAVQLYVWDKHFICCSLFLLLSWYLLRVLKVTLASCSRVEWMPSNYPAQRLSLSTEFYDCCYVRKHVFQLYSQFNCLILCVKYKAQSIFFFHELWVLRWMSWGSQLFIHTSIVRVGQHRCERVDRTWREMKPAIDDAAVNVTQMRNYCKWHETLNDYVRQLYCGNI